MRQVLAGVGRRRTRALDHHHRSLGPHRGGEEPHAAVEVHQRTRRRALHLLGDDLDQRLGARRSGLHERTGRDAEAHAGHLDVEPPAPAGIQLVTPDDGDVRRRDDPLGGGFGQQEALARSGRHAQDHLLRHTRVQRPRRQQRRELGHGHQAARQRHDLVRRAMPQPEHAVVDAEPQGAPTARGVDDRTGSHDGIVEVTEPAQGVLDDLEAHLLLAVGGGVLPIAPTAALHHVRARRLDPIRRRLPHRQHRASIGASTPFHLHLHQLAGQRPRHQHHLALRGAGERRPARHHALGPHLDDLGAHRAAFRNVVSSLASHEPDRRAARTARRSAQVRQGRIQPITPCSTRRGSRRGAVSLTP